MGGTVVPDSRWFWFGPIDAEPAYDTSLGDLHHRTRCPAVVHLAGLAEILRCVHDLHMSHRKTGLEHNVHGTLGALKAACLEVLESVQLPASSGFGALFARWLAERGYPLLLSGRDAADQVASVRFKSQLHLE
jgi:hypothetical protein